jgi:hypothetical protein
LGAFSDIGADHSKRLKIVREGGWEGRGDVYRKRERGEKEVEMGFGERDWISWGGRVWGKIRRERKGGSECFRGRWCVRFEN